MRNGWICDLGTMEYGEAFALQKAIHEAQIQGRMAEGLALVEHPPVITVGRRSRQDHLFTPLERLAGLGVSVVDTDRGGQMTYHGPGQIVAYPLVHLTAARLSLHGFVRGLEQAVIDTLEELGIAAGRIKDYTGVWVGREKVCAIGLRIRHWWNLHGLALNVRPNLEHFHLFVPCGIADHGVTSLNRLLGRDVTVDEVKPILARHLSQVLECAWTESLRPEELKKRAGMAGETPSAGGIVPVPAEGPVAPGNAIPEPGHATGEESARPESLEAESDLSDERRNGIARRLWPDLRIHHFPRIDSTNRESRRLLDGGEKPPFLVLADYQTQERGRRGTLWVSPPGASLLFSLAVPAATWSGEPLPPGPKTLVAALAIAQALEQFSPWTPMIKWPNDVLIGGRKVAGILTELWVAKGTGLVKPIPAPTPHPEPVAVAPESAPSPGSGTVAALILGIGINVHQGDKQLPRALKGLKATSLAREREAAQSYEIPSYGPDFSRMRRENGSQISGIGVSEPVSAEMRDAALSGRLRRRAPHDTDPLDRGAILERVLGSLRHLLDQPFEALRPSLIVRCTTIGRGVEIEREGLKPLVGLAVGLDADGGLQVQVAADRLERCYAGRVRELPSV